MKKAFLCALVVLLATCAFAQKWDTISASNSSCVITSCVYLPLPKDTATVSVVVTGTFLATLQVESSADGGTTLANEGTITTAGTYTYSVAAKNWIQVRGSAYTSGAAKVGITTSSAMSLTSGTLSVAFAKATVGTTTVDPKKGVLTKVPATVAASGLITDNLLALYLLDEKAGTIVRDYSGNGRHGVFGGTPTWTTAGLTISTGNYVSIPDAAWTTAKTVQYVIAGSSTSGFQGVIGTSAKNILYNNSSDMTIYSGGTWRSVESDAKVSGVRVNTAVFGATADKFYRDATESGYTTQGASINDSYGTGARICINAACSGTISFVALYSVELTPAQVASNAAAIKKLLVNRGSTNTLLGFAGDSRTVGTNATAGQDYPAQAIASMIGTYTKVNDAQSGYTTTQILTLGKTVMDPNYSIFRNYHAVIYAGGANDWINGNVTLATILANIQQYCTDRKAAGFDVCLVATIPAKSDHADAGGAPNNVSLAALNAGIKALGGSVDGYVEFNDPYFATATSSCYSDTVHFTDYCYGLWAQIARKKLLEYGIY